MKINIDRYEFIILILKIFRKFYNILVSFNKNYLQQPTASKPKVFD